MRRAGPVVALGCVALAACSLVAGFEASYEPFPLDAGTSSTTGAGGGGAGGGGSTGEAGHSGGAGGSSACTALCTTAVDLQSLPSECDACRARVVAGRPICANAWTFVCVADAIQQCGLQCCGDGICAGESCTSCPADCGECTCAHSPCKLGPALTAAECPALGSCIDDVCASKPACCISGWTQACKNQVATTCGTACNCATPICNPVQTPLSASCDPCVALVCEADPSCCTLRWSAACVSRVETLCDISCF